MSGWSAFLCHLVESSIKGVRRGISDACRGHVESAAEYLPVARWQKCMVGPLKKSSKVDSIICRIDSHSDPPRNPQLPSKMQGEDRLQGGELNCP